VQLKYYFEINISSKGSVCGEKRLAVENLGYCRLLTYRGNSPVMLSLSAVDKFECHVSFA